jgi:hypothetical protein
MDTDKEFEENVDALLKDYEKHGDEKRFCFELMRMITEIAFKQYSSMDDVKKYALYMLHKSQLLIETYELTGDGRNDRK